MHPGQGPGLSDHSLGEASGEAAVTLLVSELPSHGHELRHGEAPVPQSDPTGALPAATLGRRGGFLYGPGPGNVTMHPQAMAPVGGGMPHNNMQPFLALNFIIALQGVFPPRS
ncbi:phage tail protein [Paenibacillus sp. GCM10012303]|uniref:phage tail protein n=1 Tax=Paenibacillus sp. GCM10012303 TaxID=3317340 RepID=UPI00362174F3